MGGTTEQNTKLKHKDDLRSPSKFFKCEYSGCAVVVRSVFHMNMIP